jgi:prevent-host-death family protein
MKTVNIAEARANLSKLIDAAVAGREIVISRRNKPLIKLAPVKAEKKD